MGKFNVGIDNRTNYRPNAESFYLKIWNGTGKKRTIGGVHWIAIDNAPTQDINSIINNAWGVDNDEEDTISITRSDINRLTDDPTKIHFILKY